MEGTPRERFYAGRLLAWVCGQVPQAAWTQERAALAKGLHIDRQTPAPEVGRVAFPAVGPAGSRFITVRADLAEHDHLPVGLTQQQAAAARAALDAARLVEPNAHFRLSISTGVPWNGASWGFAVALAALSAASMRALGDRIVATGEVSPHGRIGDVGDRRDKMTLLADARPRARMYVPDTWQDVQRPGVIRCGTLERAWDMLAHPVADLDKALEEVSRLERDGQWLDAAVKAELLLDQPLEDSERARLLVLLHMAANHLADPASQQRWSSKLEEVGVLGLDDVVVARAIGTRVVSLVDDLAPDEAAAIVEEVAGRTWHGDAILHIRGPTALVRTLRGDFAGALELRQQNVCAASEAERARCLGDLADAWLRVGEPEEALRSAEKAFTCSRSAGRRRGYQVLTEAYLILYKARALRALGRDDEALTELREAPGARGPDPQVRWRLLEAEIHGDQGLVEARWKVLPDWMRLSPIVGALFERTRARLGDTEAETRLLANPLFKDLTLQEAARRLPY